MLQRGSCNGTEIPPAALGCGARGRRVPDRRGLSPNDNVDLPTEATCMEANPLMDEHFITKQLKITRLHVLTATAKGLKARHKIVALRESIFSKTFNCPRGRYIPVREMGKNIDATNCFRLFVSFVRRIGYLVRHFDECTNSQFGYSGAIYTK